MPPITWQARTARVCLADLKANPRQNCFQISQLGFFTDIISHDLIGHFSANHEEVQTLLEFSLRFSLINSFIYLFIPLTGTIWSPCVGAERKWLDRRRS